MSNWPNGKSLTWPCARDDAERTNRLTGTRLLDIITVFKRRVPFAMSSVLPLPESSTAGLSHDIHWPVLAALPCALPLDSGKISAGFPSPAADYEDRRLDINTYLIRNPVSTFFFPVEGRSMEGAEIFAGDVLVVDRSIAPQHGHIVVAFINGERLVKRLYRRADRVALVAENRDYPPIEIHEGLDLLVWGVVVGKFKRLPI